MSAELKPNPKLNISKKEEKRLSISKNRTSWC
jgi:hypothetical protein